MEKPKVDPDTLSRSLDIRPSDVKKYVEQQRHKESMAYMHHDWVAVAKQYFEATPMEVLQGVTVERLVKLLKGVHALGRAEGSQACRVQCVGQQLGDVEIAEQLLHGTTLLSAVEHVKKAT